MPSTCASRGRRATAIHLAADAADRGTDVVIACGGDGTLNEVVNGLDGRDVPLGVVPLGTANDFARQTGIPEDADHAMDVILRRKPVRIDTASMNGRRFLNVSTGGVGAEATAETPADFKASLGPLAYAITAVRKLAGDDAARHAQLHERRLRARRRSSSRSPWAARASPAAARS